MCRCRFVGEGEEETSCRRNEQQDVFMPTSCRDHIAAAGGPVGRRQGGKRVR